MNRQNDEVWQPPPRLLPFAGWALRLMAPVRFGSRMTDFLSAALRLAFLLVGLACGGCSSVNMPGRSWSGPLPPLTEEQTSVSDRIRAHVQVLAGGIGERHTRRPPSLQAAADYISESLRAAGFAPQYQAYTAKQVTQVNIEVEICGTTHPDHILIVGAHYDTVPGSRGADDNASGVAALLEMARLLSRGTFPCTVRLVFFFNEEGSSIGPNGSAIYARRCRERAENVIGMISLEMLGFYSDAPNSQSYPFSLLKLFYPATGDFILFLGNESSRRLVRRTTGAFRKYARFPSRGAAVPDFVRDAGRSDHASFWHEGYPGLMVTDTDGFRNPHYHRNSDTPETLDYDRTARVAVGLARAVELLASEK